VVESVYSAVRADCLYKVDFVERFVRISEQTATFALYIIKLIGFLLLWWKVFTARYGLIAYIKQIFVECFVRISEQTATFALYIIN
jgi:hypothetical protein